MRTFLFINIINFFLCSSFAHAVALTEEALFYRCFAQITSTRVKVNNPLLKRVINGEITATNACLQVIDNARFVAPTGTTLPSTGDVETHKAVLSTFHHLHSSWFYSKDFPLINQESPNLGEKDLYDTSTPALYFTQALFSPTGRVENVVKSNAFLRPIRTNMNPNRGPRKRQS